MTRTALFTSICLLTATLAFSEDILGQGKLKSDGKTFIHPHGVAVDAEGNLYVAQFSSPAAPLLKLERLK